MCGMGKCNVCERAHTRTHTHTHTHTHTAVVQLNEWKSKTTKRDIMSESSLDGQRCCISLLLTRQEFLEEKTFISSTWVCFPFSAVWFFIRKRKTQSPLNMTLMNHLSLRVWLTNFDEPDSWRASHKNSQGAQQEATFTALALWIKACPSSPFKPPQRLLGLSLL